MSSSEIFAKALKYMLSNEGSYSNDSNDNGGETVYGISRRIWPQWAGWSYLDKKYQSLNKKVIDTEIETLMPMVSEFYYSTFWNSAKLSHISDDKLVIKLFDHFVNGGIAMLKVFQNVLNTLSDSKDEDIIIDGDFGQQTISRYNKISSTSRSALILPLYRSLISSTYSGIASKNHTQKVFIAGWLNRAEKMPI